MFKVNRFENICTLSIIVRIAGLVAQSILNGTWCNECCRDDAHGENCSKHDKDCSTQSIKPDHEEAIAVLSAAAVLLFGKTVYYMRLSQSVTFYRMTLSRQQCPLHMHVVPSQR